MTPVKGAARPNAEMDMWPSILLNHVEPSPTCLMALC